MEIIALPAFIFLVLHLVGHAIVPLWEAIAEHGHDHEAVEHGHNVLQELLLGVPFLIVFVWIWQRPVFKKWIPCAHEHCHHGKKTTHILAIGALCFHFFPEAGVRHLLIQQSLDSLDWISLIGLIGFAAHFLVDVFVSIAISSYWSTRLQFWMSFSIIASMWFLALCVGTTFVQHVHDISPMLFFFSAFFLAMFIHRPHKPIQCCVGK